MVQEKKKKDKYFSTLCDNEMRMDLNLLVYFANDIIGQKARVTERPLFEYLANKLKKNIQSSSTMSGCGWLLQSLSLTIF